MWDTIVGLAPLAAGLAVFGAAVWFLLARNVGLGSWLLAAFLIGHGLVQLMFLMPQPATAPANANGVAYPFDMARSWLVTGLGLDVSAVRTIGSIIIAVVVVGFTLAGLATVGVLIPTGWWPGLVLGATVASAVLLTIFWSPGLLLGVAINVALLWIVTASVWAPGGGFAMTAPAR